MRYLCKVSRETGSEYSSDEAIHGVSKHATMLSYLFANSRG